MVAESIPSNKSLHRWKEFRAEYGKNWQVEWHQDRDSPLLIYGSVYSTGRGLYINATGADEIARNFIEDNKGLLKIDQDSKLNLNQILRFGKLSYGYRVTYQQTYKDIPVYMANVLVFVSENSEITRIFNEIYLNVSTPTTPKLSQEEAIEIALQNDTTNRLYEKEPISLIIVPKTENKTIKYPLTWKITTLIHFVYVDAITGEVVLKEVTAVPLDETGTEEVPSNQSIAPLNETIFNETTGNVTGNITVEEEISTETKKVLKKTLEKTVAKNGDEKARNQFIRYLPIIIGAILVVLIIFTLVKSGKNR